MIEDENISPGTACDLCAANGLSAVAVADRRVGACWAYVCGPCRRRVDGPRALTVDDLPGCGGDEMMPLESEAPC